MILVVCLNPALQRTLWFDRFEQGAVNRASRKALSAGGKGINVTRMIAALGEGATLLTVLGGDAGKQVGQYIDKDQISYCSVPVQTETRNCTTLLDLKGQKQTELVEEGNAIAEPEVEAVIQAFQKQLSKSQFCVISGTALPGFPKTIYREFVRLAGQNGVRTFIDTSGDLLKETFCEKPFFVKPNWKEMELLTRTRIRTIRSMKTFVKKICEDGADNVLVTAGSSPSILYHENRFYRICPPDVKVVNPIGAGDAVAAGISVGQIRNLSMIESVRLGIACGTASCQTPIAGTVRQNDVQTFLSRVRVEPL